MRVHLLCLPNTQLTAAFELDGFCQLNRRFVTLLKRMGHEVILYGSEEHDTPADRLMTCISKAEIAKCLGATPYQSVEFEANSSLFVTFNARAAAQLGTIKRSEDVIATIGGTAHLPVLQQHPELIGLEYSIGYRGVCAPYRIYESHVWRHCVHGFTGLDGGRDFDDVIPPFWEVSEFPFRAQAGAYVAYCGRMVPRKGIATACEAAKAAGVPLVVVGHGDPSLVTYGEYRGALSTTARNEVLAGARAVLMPTQYIEPFGQVAAEAQLCGTPVISTDFGAFVESIDHGVTGFRCRYLGEFVQAIHAAGDLDRVAIRERAEALYGMDAADASYRRYFARLALLKTDGWHSLVPGLQDAKIHEPVFA